MGLAILLTGVPGSGKTTAIKEILASLNCQAGGFYTQEIRTKGRRMGFKLITLDGREGLLAHRDFKGPHRIGRYGVDLTALETIGVEAIQQATAELDLVVIDEIGPMELISDRFRRAVLTALESDRPMLGSIVQRPTPFTDRVKAIPSVRILRIHRGNRALIVNDVVNHLCEEGLVKNK